MSVDRQKQNQPVSVEVEHTLTPNQRRRDYFREREQLRRKERARNGECRQCGGEWIEPLKTHRGKPKHCRKCQIYYHTRYNEKKEKVDD